MVAEASHGLAFGLNVFLTQDAVFLFYSREETQTIKRYTGQLTNTWSAWETSVLTDVVRDHINDVAAASWSSSSALVAASDPAPACKFVLQTALQGAVNDVVKISLDATSHCHRR